MPTESTPSRNAETPSKQTPSRTTFRDLSNSVTKGVSSLLSWSTPTKPSAPATQSGAETPDPNGATPQPGAWQSADNFKFVEEDDDEVLFRVRDSGVLRSLTTPSFPSGSEDTSSGEDIEAKQARVRAMRLSYITEKPPSSLSALPESDMDKPAESPAKEAATAPSSAAKPPPPALSDELWGELQQEVKRQSIEPELHGAGIDESFVSAGDDADALATDDLAGHGDATDCSASAVDGDMFATAMDGMAATAASATAAVGDTQDDKSTPAAEEEEESMTVEKLLEMGFSAEEAEWAVKQASDNAQGLETVQENNSSSADAAATLAPVIGEEEKPASAIVEDAVAEQKEDAVEEAAAAPAFVSSSPPIKAKAAPVDVVPLDKCIRRAGCTCRDCLDMAGISLNDLPPPAPKEEEPAPAAVEEKEEEKSAEAVAEPPAVVEAMEESVVAEEPAAAAAAAVEEEKVEAAAPPAFVSSSPPIKAKAAPVDVVPLDKCIRRAGCTCRDCLDMAGISLATPVSHSEVPAQVEEDKPAEEQELDAAADEPDVVVDCKSAVTESVAAAVIEEGEEEDKFEECEEGSSSPQPASAPLAVASPAAVSKKKAPISSPGEMTSTQLDLSTGCFKETDGLASTAVKTPVAKVSAKKGSSSAKAFRAGASGSNMFSPGSNAAALKELMDDDDADDLDISIADFEVTGKWDTTAAAPPAPAPAPAVVAPIPEKEKEPAAAQVAKAAAPDAMSVSNGRMHWEVNNEFAPAPAAPTSSLADSFAGSRGPGGGRAIYTLEDVERIASFQTDAIQAKAEREKAELTGQLSALEQESTKTKEKLTAENLKLRDAIKEAEKTVDAMAKVMETERKEAKRVAKENAENKSYADELETAFNELHERYTKLKEYYTVADAKNVELSQSLLQTNELLQQSQAQVLAREERVRLADESRAVEVAAAKDEMRKEMAKVVADAEEARGAMSKLNEKVQELHRDVADKESLVVQANVRVQLGQQEAMELRAKTEEWRVACATTQQQLKTKVASLEASEQRVAAQEEELNELRGKVSESQPAGENEVKLLKAQLMKAQLDKKALQSQLDAKVADNASLSTMCDELLQQMEASKS